MFDIATIIWANVATATTVHGPGKARAALTGGSCQEKVKGKTRHIVWTAPQWCKTHAHDAVCAPSRRVKTFQRRFLPGIVDMSDKHF
jgi:hypothetical protein